MVEEKKANEEETKKPFHAPKLTKQEFYSRINKKRSTYEGRIMDSQDFINAS